MLYRSVLDDQKALTDALEATENPVDGSVNSIVQLLALAKPAAIPILDEAQKDSAELDLIRNQLSQISKSIEVLSNKVLLGREPSLEKALRIENHSLHNHLDLSKNEHIFNRGLKEGLAVNVNDVRKLQSIYLKKKLDEDND